MEQAGRGGRTESCPAPVLLATPTLESCRMSLSPKQEQFGQGLKAAIVPTKPCVLLVGGELLALPGRQ